MIAGLSAAFACTLALTVVVPALRRRQVLDLPNQRSSHQHATPRGGGIAVLFGFLCGLGASLVVGKGEAGGPTLVVAAAALVLATVGLLDDLSGLGSGVRLAAQVCVGGTAAVVLLRMVSGLGVAGVGLAVVGTVWFVACVNAVNFMDGINGISAWTAVVAGAWYAFIGVDLADPQLVACGVALVGAATAFLPWNAVRARVFLGDVGSYGIGAVLALLALWVAVRHQAFLAAVAPLSVYLVDTGFTLWRRWRSGAELRRAHREHVYQRLVLRGWSHPSVALLVAGLAGAVSLGVLWLPWPAATGASVALLVVYLALPAQLERVTP